jgi:hypothetical protein
MWNLGNFMNRLFSCYYYLLGIKARRVLCRLYPFSLIIHDHHFVYFELHLNNERLSPGIFQYFIHLMSWFRRERRWGWAVMPLASFSSGPKYKSRPEDRPVVAPRIITRHWANPISFKLLFPVYCSELSCYSMLYKQCRRKANELVTHPPFQRISLVNIILSPIFLYHYKNQHCSV